MGKEFEGSVALVTGGSQGIGRAIAEAFAKKGASVVICARQRQEVELAAREIASSGGRCQGIALDVSNASAVQSAVASLLKSYGRIDILVACAGIYGPIGALEGNDPQAWGQAIMINLCGTAFSVQAVLPSMKRRGSGCIITLAGAGAGGPSIKPNISAYTSSKFGVCGFTEAVAKELEGTGVRINAISPGAVNTRLLDEVLSSGARAGREFLAASKRQKETGGTPPEKAAGLALYLASGQAGRISGKVLSAVWDTPEKMERSADKPSAFCLRRIDGELFFEK